MVAAEYVLVFFVVIAVISGMSAYFRRALQAKVRDAHYSMINTVRNKVGGAYTGTNVYVQYEPYYTNSTALVNRNINNEDRLIASYPLSSGIFRKNKDERTATQATSITNPPINAD